jgi:hypothetical protein
MDNSEKLATQGIQDEEKNNNKTTQYVLDIIIYKQTHRFNLSTKRTTIFRLKPLNTKDHDTWLGNPGPGKIIKNVA